MQVTPTTAAIAAMSSGDGCVANADCTQPPKSAHAVVHEVPRGASIHLASLMSNNARWAAAGTEGAGPGGRGGASAKNVVSAAGRLPVSVGVATRAAEAQMVANSRWCILEGKGVGRGGGRVCGGEGWG